MIAFTLFFKIKIIPKTDKENLDQHFSVGFAATRWKEKVETIFPTSWEMGSATVHLLTRPKTCGEWFVKGARELSRLLSRLRESLDLLCNKENGVCMISLEITILTPVSMLFAYCVAEWMSRSLRSLRHALKNRNAKPLFATHSRADAPGKSGDATK